MRLQIVPMQVRQCHRFDEVLKAARADNLSQCLKHPMAAAYWEPDQEPVICVVATCSVRATLQR